MRNFLAFVGAAVLTFLAIGYYLGWYNITREATTPGHSRLQVDINQEKIGQDVKQGSDKLKDAIDKHVPESSTTQDKKPIGSDALIAPPPGKTTSQEKAKDAAKEAFKGLLTDGWFAPPEKK
jgi:apolipoprotein N-acyltransferase